jgi:hypothetical protein
MVFPIVSRVRSHALFRLLVRETLENRETDPTGAIFGRLPGVELHLHRPFHQSLAISPIFLALAVNKAAATLPAIKTLPSLGAYLLQKESAKLAVVPASVLIETGDDELVLGFRLSLIDSFRILSFSVK